MNGYYRTMAKNFWIAQEAYQLGTSEIALFFYLLEISDKAGQTGCFHRNNQKVMTDLGIKSYKTLQSVRDRLKAAEVIQYQQKNGSANVRYELTDLSKKYQGYYQGSGKGLVQGQGKGLGEVNTYYTTQVQTLTKLFKELRTGIGEEIAKGEAIKLLAKKPDLSFDFDMSFIVAWAHRIKLNGEQVMDKMKNV